MSLTTILVCLLLKHLASVSTEVGRTIAGAKRKIPRSVQRTQRALQRSSIKKCYEACGIQQNTRVGQEACQLTTTEVNTPTKLSLINFLLQIFVALMNAEIIIC